MDCTHFPTPVTPQENAQQHADEHRIAEGDFRQRFRIRPAGTDRLQDCQENREGGQGLPDIHHGEHVGLAGIEQAEEGIPHHAALKIGDQEREKPSAGLYKAAEQEADAQTQRAGKKNDCQRQRQTAGILRGEEGVKQNSHQQHLAHQVLDACQPLRIKDPFPGTQPAQQEHDQHRKHHFQNRKEHVQPPYHPFSDREMWFITQAKPLAHLRSGSLK